MSDVVERTEKYYDSPDADEFYFRIWGGEDIHIGTYREGETDIGEASRRTVENMAKKLSDLPPDTRVVDIGAGYGGSARFLAKHNGFSVSCLNLSKVQNDRNREMNAKAGLEDRIDVVDGDFENLPYETDAFDVAFSQDAFLHSGNRKRVFEEIDRVLKPGGRVIFTDPMQKGDADKAALQPVLDRIHLETMGSIEQYKGYAEALGWDVVEIEETPHQLVNHYSAVLHNLESRHEAIKGIVSEDYVENMKNGLRHWIAAGKDGQLDWGILVFRKRA